MKELSVEEKAKRYDDLLVKLQEAKVDNNVCDDRYCCVIDDIVPELKESDDEKIRKEIKAFIKSRGSQITQSKTDGWLAWLKKQGEQKPADKVESKFNAGDWIIYDGWTTQIKEVYEDGYSNIHRGFIPKDREDSMRLWTIQDAKDGDVLSYRDGRWVFIYKGIVTEDTFKYYALLSEKDITLNDAAFSLLLSCITPATKEQREQLEKAMADVGYTFDFEKKELNKIEQKPAWSEEDEGKLKSVISLMKSNRSEDPFYDKMYLKNWLLSLKDRVQPKQEWSEDDENIKESIITGLEMLKDGASDESLIALYNKKIDWLKSLRPPYYCDNCKLKKSIQGWKPSDEQIGVIEAVINNRSFQRRHLDSLYADLKKLSDE